MKKRSAVILVLVLSVLAYIIFFQPEPQRFSRVLERGSYASPDGKYEVVMELCLSDTDSESGWFRGTIFKNRNESAFIYWDKAEGDALIRATDVVWIDENAVMIEGKEFNVSNFPEIDFYVYKEA